MEHRFRKAWSEYFHAWIVCVRYVSDSVWWFVLLNFEDQHPICARSRYSQFDWQEISLK